MCSLRLSNSLLCIFLCSSTWTWSPALPDCSLHFTSSHLSTMGVILPSHWDCLHVSGKHFGILWRDEIYYLSYAHAMKSWIWSELLLNMTLRISQSTGSVGRGGNAGARKEVRRDDGRELPPSSVFGWHPAPSWPLLLDSILDLLALLKQMGTDTRMSWHGKSRMHEGFRAPSSPLLLNLGLMLTAVCLLLLYNHLGNKLNGKKSLPGTCNGQICVHPKGKVEKGWAQGKMLGLICNQSNERSKSGSLTLQNDPRLC